MAAKAYRTSSGTILLECDACHARDEVAQPQTQEQAELVNDIYAEFQAEHADCVAKKYERPEPVAEYTTPQGIVVTDRRRR